MGLPLISLHLGLPLIYCTVFVASDLLAHHFISLARVAPSGLICHLYCTCTGNPKWAYLSLYFTCAGTPQRIAHHLIQPFTCRPLCWSLPHPFSQLACRPLHWLPQGGGEGALSFYFVVAFHFIVFTSLAPLNCHPLRWWLQGPPVSLFTNPLSLLCSPRLHCSLATQGPGISPILCCYFAGHYLH